MEEFHKAIESCGSTVRNTIIYSVVVLLATYLIFLFVLVLTNQELKVEQASLVSILSFSVILSLGLSFKGILSALGTLRERLAVDSDQDKNTHKEAIIKIEISKMLFLTKALKWLSPVYLSIFITVFIVFGIVNQDVTYHTSTVSMMAFLGLFIILLPGILIAQTGGRLSSNVENPEANKFKWIIASTIIVAFAGGGVLGFLNVSKSGENPNSEVYERMNITDKNIEKVLYQLEQLNLRSSITK